MEETHVFVGKTFQEAVLAFLEAILISKAYVPDLAKRWVKAAGVADEEALCIAIEAIFDNPGLKNYYNGFRISRTSAKIVSFAWVCELPSPLLRYTANDDPTRVILERCLYDSGSWQLRVVAREKGALTQRLRAAQGLPALTVAHRIVRQRLEA